MSHNNEKKIVSEIKERWRKDKYKRKETDINRICNEFREICSSRSSIIYIIKKIEKYGLNKKNLLDLKDKMDTIFDWINKESINSIKEKYIMEVKDKRKLNSYKNEVRFIDEYYCLLKATVVSITVNKLLDFHMVGGEIEND